MAIKRSRPLVGRVVELAEFSPQGFGHRVLTETDGIRVVVAALEDGQEIPLHAPPLDIVIVPAGQTRGLRATGGRLVAVNVVSPPPGAGHHAGSEAAWPVGEDTRMSAP